MGLAKWPRHGQIEESETESNQVPNVNASIPRLFKFAGLFAACALFAHYFAAIRMFTATYYDPASLPHLLAGRSPGPFQYRALFVWLIAAIRDHGWFPNPIHGLKELCYVVDALVTYAIFVVTWFYLGLFIRSARIKAIGLLLLMFVLSMTYLVPVILSAYYVSDLPAILFFTLGLYLIRTEKMLLFYILYAVASLNRETFAFLSVVYVLVNADAPKRKLVVSCAIQGMILLLIRAYLVSIYGYRPHCQFKLHDNWTALTTPFSAFQAMSGVGLLWLFPVLGWRLIADPFIRRACLVLPVFGAVAFCTANLDEIRVYGELTPIVLPAALLVMHRLFQDTATPVTAR